MFIVKRIYPYVKNRAKRQTIEMSKLHMVDTGLACHLLGIKKKQQLLDSSFYGGLLESFVVMEQQRFLLKSPALYEKAINQARIAEGDLWIDKVINLLQMILPIMGFKDENQLSRMLNDIRMMNC